MRKTFAACALLFAALTAAGRLWAAPYGAGYYDTSEYMMGRVLANIVFVESDGGIDAQTENWSAARKNEVITEVTAAMNFWQALDSRAQLSFTVVSTTVGTGYEPISRSSADDYLWINEVLGRLGYTESGAYGYIERAYHYDNDLRALHGTDWAFTIFVADSDIDADGKFTDGYFAYAYPGGPFQILTYDNNGWGIADMNSVCAHETGHIFHAGDEYYQAGYGGCGNCTDRYGYLNITNSNCTFTGCPAENNPPGCLMYSGNVNSGACSVTREQIGWRDTDSNGVFDILDLRPTVTLRAYTPDPVTDNTPTYEGMAHSTAAYANQNNYVNTWHEYFTTAVNDITINTVGEVAYRVDGGAWTPGTATDGNYNQNIESYTFTADPLGDGQHTFEARARTSAYTYNVAYPADFLTIHQAGPSAVPYVYDGTGADMDTITTTASLSANWGTSSDAVVGLKKYWFFVGTQPSESSPFLAWRDNGLSVSTTVAGLSLANGTTYYFGVKAENNLGTYSAVAWSDGQMPDTNTPQGVPYVYDGAGADASYASSRRTLSANWGASPAPNITRYVFAVGTTPGGTDTLDWTDNGLSYSTTTSALSLSDATTYYFAVRAQNALGFYSAPAASNGIKVDVTSPTAVVLITSTVPARVGPITFRLIVSDANGVSGTPTLAFAPPGGATQTVPMTYAALSTWTGTSYIESWYSTGAASVGFSAYDPAGNPGSQITSGASFLIDTAVSGASGGSVVNSDSTTVILPAGGYSGSLVITVSTVPSARTAAADQAAKDSYTFYPRDLTREFLARDSATGAPVTYFASTLTIRMCYPDADGDGYMDGNYINESLSRLYLLDEANNVWLPVTEAAFDASANRFTLQTPHFSVYTIRVLDVSRLGMSVVKAYPNPCYLDRPPYGLRIDGIPLDASRPAVKIYNTAGELVRSLAPGDGMDASNKVFWDGGLKGGGKAASGLYLYVVTTGNYGKAEGKFYLFR